MTLEEQLNGGLTGPAELQVPMAASFIARIF